MILTAVCLWFDQVLSVDGRFRILLMGKIIENYSLQALIAEGNYGRVFRGVNIKTKQEVAIKVIKAQKFRDMPKLQECTVNEINTLSNIEDNPHIVRYIDMLKTVNNFYFVYEFCNGGTLEKLINTHKTTQGGVMPETQAVIYFQQILKAFKTLTKYHIMHRDLKPGNILLNNGIIKIADFGFCKTLNSSDDMVQTMLGSPIYMAPEVLKGETYTMKADIWSLGVVLYEMLVGECPFQSNSIAKLIQILDSQDLQIPKTVHSSLEKLIRRMLVKDQFRRIDWVDLFEYKLPEAGDLDLKARLSNSSTNRNNKGQSMTSSSESTTYLSRENLLKAPSSKLQASQNTKDQHILRRSPTKPQYLTSNTLVPTLKNVANSSRTFLSKSPFAQNDNFQFNISTYINTHKKTVQLNRLAIEVGVRGCLQALVVSYLLSKGTEAQLVDILTSITKQLDKKGVSSSCIHQYSQIQKTITSQIQCITELMRLYKVQLQKASESTRIWGVSGQSKNRQIRSYVKNLQLQKEESTQMLVHASQILDYFQDGILLKKESYQRLSKEQLIRQIQSKLSKLE